MPTKRRTPWKKMPFPLLIFALGLSIGYRSYEYFPAHKRIEVSNANAIFDIRFSPRGGSLQLILDSLAKAQAHIYVHAYSFTSKEITEALIKAHLRGVKVLVIADKRESKNRYCRLQELKNVGIQVRIDKVSGLAHNKIMVIDSDWVITGSYNWSAAAEKRNAENILRITNEKINACYEENFFARYSKGEVYGQYK